MAVVQYTAEEEKRIKDVLAAFHEYINDNKNFDIIFSNLYGYLWLPATISNDGQYKDGCYNIIRTEQDLFKFLFWELHTDLIMELREKDLDKYRLEQEDIELLRHRVEAYVDNMSDSKDNCLSCLEQCINKVINDPYIV